MPVSNFLESATGLDARQNRRTLGFIPELGERLTPDSGAAALIFEDSMGLNFCTESCKSFIIIL